MATDKAKTYTPAELRNFIRKTLSTVKPDPISGITKEAQHGVEMFNRGFFQAKMKAEKALLEALK